MNQISCNILKPLNINATKVGRQDIPGAIAIAPCFSFIFSGGRVDGTFVTKTSSMTSAVGVQLRTQVTYTQGTYEFWLIICLSCREAGQDCDDTNTK